MVERRLIALALATVGVWLEWSLGAALIVAGIGVAASGIEPRTMLDRAVARTRGSLMRLRAAAAAMPRRSAAIALVCVASVLLPLAVLAAVGPWFALALLGGIFLIDGHLLGWE